MDMPLTSDRTQQLRTVGLALLQGKTWRYLRYLHARQAVAMVADEIDSVLVVGAGHGLAELALAIEFPSIQWRLTDWGGASHNTSKANDWMKAWAIDNISRSVLDVLDPNEKPGAFDMVYSVEVLEHIENDSLAAANMRSLARKYVFCMVPFAEEATNLNTRMRARAWEKCEHYLCGYNPQRLLTMFNSPVAIRGAYWRDRGQSFRADLQILTPEQITSSADTLMIRAQSDMIDRIPTRDSEAQGIWWLSRP